MQLSVIKDNYHGHRRSPWLVVVPARLSPTGRRKYSRFTTRAAAQSYIAQLRLHLRLHGEKAVAILPAALAADASAARELLAGTGLSLMEAAQKLLAAMASPAVAFASTCAGVTGDGMQNTPPSAAASAPVNLKAALAALQSASKHLRPSSQQARRGIFSGLFSRVKGLAELPLASITPEILRNALDTAWPHSDTSWNSGRRQLSALFGFLIKRRWWLAENPVKWLELKRVQESEIRALHPDDLLRLFAACRAPLPSESGPDAYNLEYLRPFVAICAFAGVRPTECMGLRWHDVDWEDNVLSVRNKTAKTGGTRHIPICPTLRAWLIASRPANAAPDDLITSPTSWCNRRKLLHKRAGYNSQNPWVNDALRHSYATYFLKAQQGSIHTLQLNMGHRDSHLLYQRYTNMRGVNRAMADDWWQILPPAAPQRSGDAVTWLAPCGE